MRPSKVCNCYSHQLRKALSYALADAIDGSVINADEASTALFGICDILDTAKSIAKKEDKNIGKYLDGGWSADKNGTNSYETSDTI